MRKRSSIPLRDENYKQASEFSSSCSGRLSLISRDPILMTESQSVLKRQKSDYNSGCKRLIDLPLSIIYTILSFLPIKEAVRTSILSREWRYTWTGLPILEFISNRNSSISTIYSCNKLTRLRLDWCNVGPPPLTFNGFPFLRNLTLNRVMISSAAFESIVSSSPLLERLYVDQSRNFVNNSIIRVHAPNLKYLKLLGCWTEMSMNAPLLATMDIVLSVNELHGANRTDMSTNAPLLGPLCNYTNFLGGCTNLEELNGFGQFTQVMSIGMESWNPNPLVFNRLTTMSLNDVDFRDIKQQSVLARLLVGAPNLQNLRIVGCLQPMYSWKTQDTDFSGFKFGSNFRMEKLRVVKMDRVRGLLSEIKLIQILLERSPLLEMMSVRHVGYATIKVLKHKILGCTRASQNAKISVRQM